MNAKAAKTDRRASKATAIINAHTLMLDNTVLPMLNALIGKVQLLELRVKILEKKATSVDSASSDAPHAD